VRTNIEIDDKLMKQAMKATGATTKKGAVEAAMRRLAELRAAEVERKEYVRRRRGAWTAEDDWLEKWLSSGWAQSRTANADCDRGGPATRTNIEIDDKLLRKTMSLSPRTTKKAVVEEALILAVKLHRQGQALRKLRGIGWEGDLSAMRQSRFPDWDEAKQPLPEDMKIPAA
jgi:Arc/MetJ family transcription regulator